MSADDSKYLDFTRQPDFQQILTNPILDIAARFWEEERYMAFRTCYRSMRIIDDLVDDNKICGSKLTKHEKEELAHSLRVWFEALKREAPRDKFQEELIGTLHKFSIPLWPWQKLLKAMLYDLDHRGFATFMVFLRYAEGAAVAPASVFMHLCGIREENGEFHPPTFDIRPVARPLALFSYLVHIIRDFQKDHRSGLNYFAENLLRDCDLSEATLKDIAHNEEIPMGFRSLMARYQSFADYYRILARRAVDSSLSDLKPPYRLSLEIIYSLYLQIFERIDVVGGRFTAEELNPTQEEVRRRLLRTISEFRAEK